MNGKKIRLSASFSPEDVAKRAIAVLKSKADPEKAVQAQRYFKEQVSCYGLTSGEVRDIAAQLHRSMARDWTLRHAVDFCEILLPNKYLEAKSIAILTFLRHQKEFGPTIFSTVKKWLARDYCDNWATVDVLCPDALGGMLEGHPGLVAKIKTWTASPNRWVKRASAVSFIKLVRRGKHLDAAYAVARRLFPVEDDLIEKANGWLLRETGKTDTARLEAFLLHHGPKIPRTTLRYAIERFPEPKRRKILFQTKPR